MEFLTDREIEDAAILKAFLKDENFIMFRGIEHPQETFKVENLKKEISSQSTIDVDFIEEKNFILELEKNETVLYWDYLPDIKIGYDINGLTDIYEPTFCIYFNKSIDKNTDNIEIAMVDLFPYEDLLNIPLYSYDHIIAMNEEEFMKYEEFMEKSNFFVKLYNLIDDYANQHGMKFYLFFNNNLLQIKKIINIY